MRTAYIAYTAMGYNSTLVCETIKSSPCHHNIEHAVYMSQINLTLSLFINVN